MQWRGVKMEKCIERIKQGTKYVRLVSPVTRKELIAINGKDDEYLKMKCVKFIPASGAATRMFEDLYKYLEEKVETEYIKFFFDSLEKFPFYDDLKECIKNDIIDKNKDKSRVKILECLLDCCMNYGDLPKALIKIKSYGEFSTTPIDEHIFEGEKYLNPEGLNFHLTISEKYEDLFNIYINKIINGNEKINISYSFQKKKTDTIAVDMENKPIMMEDGKFLYWPGGHGALIENLNDIDGDIIFIKNIDNVCHRDYIEDMVNSKKELASIGFQFKKKIDRYINDLLAENYDMIEVTEFIENDLNIKTKRKMTKERALSFLNRPLRVCGVVKNQGEPGGAPFLVDHGEYIDLQICEKSEIDINNEEQYKKICESEFFNPVDLVCFVKDYKGNKFNLLEYVNEERYFITQKTYKGKDVKVLEHPGLWNGAMHNWNTVLVEVPLSTFNPIKKVNDLLK